MPAGRPTLFSDVLSKKICELVEGGKTIEQIADILSINPRTLQLWMQKKPDFMRDIKESRQKASELVEASLYHRAMGYSIPEEKVFCNSNGEVTKVTTLKHYPPDPTAMIFWLKNRSPDAWKDKTEVDQTGTILLGAASREQLIEMCLNARQEKKIEAKKIAATETEDE
jgi:hypothetical protein